MIRYSYLFWALSILVMACSQSDPNPLTPTPTPPTPKPIGNTVNLPTLTTRPVTMIKSSSATSGGEIVSDGGSPIINRGVVWSSSGIPTIDYLTKTVNGNGKDPFTSILSGLSPSTKYHVRAYATNSTGTGYGDTYTFTTSSTPPVPFAFTIPPIHITQTEAIVGGDALSEEGLIDKGFVWSTINPPTLDDQMISLGKEDGAFDYTLSGLTPNTTYYVRAYATNLTGTGYGIAIPFTTFPQTPEGVQVVQLLYSWAIAQVTLDGIDRTNEFENFQLTLFGYSGQSSYGYTTQNRPAISPWLYSGIWIFGTDVEADMIRDYGTPDEIGMTYHLSGNTLEITYAFNGDGYPARTREVEGTWVFRFEKED